MTTTTTNELTNGRWLGQRGIFCHNVPAVEDIDPKDWDGEPAQHTMVTAVTNGVRGELIRWAWKDGEVSYEARINGTEDHGGTCDVVAYGIDSLCALSKVANDLRYMLEAILDPDTRGAWSTWSV